MTQKEVTNKMKQNVKDTVEFIYNLTKNGYSGGLKTDVKLKPYQLIVATVLAEHGALIRTYSENHHPHYQWNNNIVPDYLYCSNVIRWYRRKWDNNNKKKYMKDNIAVEESQAVEPVTQIDMNNTNESNDVLDAIVAGTENEGLEKYSDTQLWDELKHRGYEGKITKTVVTTLD